MTFMRFHYYSRLREGFDEGEIKGCPECLACRCNQNSVWNSKLLIIFTWILASIFGALSAVLWIKWPLPSSLGSYELGFNTDLRDFGHGAQVPLEKVKFVGNLFFPANETLNEPLRQPSDKIAGSKKKQYFGDFSGPPSQEIDNNWEKLIEKRYVSISEEEARRAWGDKASQYVDKHSGGYSAGLDVLHSLHCLNYLRKGFFPDHYPRDFTFEIHRDHCIDILRQGVQCCGSTTLIPTMFMSGLNRSTIDSDQVHTCRSFDFLREWTTQRGVGGILYEGKQSLSTGESEK